MNFLGQLYFQPLWLLAQATTGGATPAAPAATPAAAPADWTEGLFNPLNFMLIAMLLLWVMVILPQQRQSREQAKQLANHLKNLKKNDRVVTSAGIHGTIVNISPESPTVTIRVDESTNSKLTLNRDAITKVIVDEPKKEGN